MASWNGVPLPTSPSPKIPNSIPQNFNWDSFKADPKGTFNKFKGARETHRLNWKGYRTASASTKKIIASSPSKKFIADAGKRIRQLKKVADTTKKVADATKKATDLTEKIQAALFKNVPGSAILDKASRIGGILGILAAIGAVAILKLNEFVSSRTFDNLDSINNDLTKTNQLAVQAGLKLKTIDAKIQKFGRELDANAKDYYRLNKQQESFGKDLVEAKKKANDSLYETREGRKILESKITEAKKQANDSLYETREGRKILEGKITEQRTSFEAKIQQVNAQIAKFTSGVSDNFQKTVNATISKIQSDLAATRAKVDAIRPATPTDTAAINANAVAAARAIVNPLQFQIGQLAGTVGSLQGQAAQIPILANSIGSLAQNLNTVNAKADAAMNEARNKGVPNLAPIQQQLDDKFNRFVADNNKALGIVGINQSNLAKEFDNKLAEFNRQSNLTADQRFNEFKRENDKALGIVGINQSNLAKEFDAKLTNFQRQSNLTADQRFEEFQKQNKADLGLIKSSLTTTQSDVGKLDTKIKEQAKVNEQALPKLDQIVTILGLIPARAASAIRPDIPTIPQIEGAAATGTCRTLQPGGCMRKAFDANADGITNNNNKNAGNILDAINTGANAALLQGQQTILARLGDQLPGGIGGKLSRFAQWAHLDRALNIMNFAANVHNAAMLSNNLGQTLLSVIGNILSIIGLKDAEGQAFDIGSIISKSIEGIIKGAIGEKNYKILDSNWKRANRIYQATANILNSIQSIGASILNALEIIGEWNARVANALKAFGVVGERAYAWFNPNINFQNKYFTALENATNVVSQVDQVASEVLSIKETVGQLKDQKKELDESLKQTDNSKQKPESSEATKIKAAAEASKLVSVGTELNQSDKNPDD
ncbi:hypothetical protein NIES4072_63940 [Nostoc commune NIES-4072]|uniref:Uncharacterized protein n=1 Tax=Nostoc commune NIES-4072 TaxID=2005467 RepID=A0A2R5FV99_NOSCO|nr:hypothetical protein [Nostoc commune]BBD66337.1 hypothetical protein NIES4070_27020 [Nostoc commune HK-02]GBG22682.1 hypothetical protein NIES4072_63940 [Nostoc commune NIES-4072]